MVTLNPKDSENPAFLLYINFKSNGFVLSIFEEKDSRERRNPPRPTTSHLRRETARGWPYTKRLQHSKGIDAAFGPTSAWWGV